jgi:hypothetical protein
MLYNRVYYTVRKTYRNLKYHTVHNRKFVTTNSGSGGGGDPKMDSLLTIMFMGSFYYIISKRT